MISDRNIRLYYLSQFFQGLIFHMPVWVAYELQFISLAELALIEAIMQSSQLLSELPTGAVADLLGKRASVIIGRIIALVGLTIYANATHFGMFVVYAVVSGIGDSFVSGALDALIYDSLKQDGKSDRYPKIASKASLIFQLAFAGAIFAGGVLSIWGYKVAIYATLFSIFGALCVEWFYKEPVIDTEKFTIPRYFRQFQLGFHELFKNPYIRDVSLFYIGVGGITWSAMMIFNTSLLTTIGYTTFEIGIIVAIIRLLNSSVLFGAIHLNTIVTKRRAYLFFPILMLICYLPGLFLTKELAVLAVAVSIFVSTSRWVVLGSYVNEQYNSKFRATALSTLSMIVSVVVVAFAVTSGPIMNYFGGVRAMFTVLGICSLLVVLPLGLRIRARYHALPD